MSWVRNVTKTERNLCCPEITWTGLVTTQITGKQHIFTENANKPRTLKDMFSLVSMPMLFKHQKVKDRENLKKYFQGGGKPPYL